MFCTYCLLHSTTVKERNVYFHGEENILLIHYNKVSIHRYDVEKLHRQINFYTSGESSSHVIFQVLSIRADLK
jgi:hypothetical protein